MKTRTMISSLVLSAFLGLGAIASAIFLVPAPVVSAAAPAATNAADVIKVHLEMSLHGFPLSDQAAKQWLRLNTLYGTRDELKESVAAYVGEKDHEAFVKYWKSYGYADNGPSEQDVRQCWKAVVAITDENYQVDVSDAKNKKISSDVILEIQQALLVDYVSAINDPRHDKNEASLALTYRMGDVDAIDTFLYRQLYKKADYELLELDERYDAAKTNDERKEIQKEVKEAEKTMEKAYWMERAKEAYTLGDFERSSQCFAKLMNLYPEEKPSYLYYFLGRMYLRTHEYRKAYQCFLTVQEINPDFSCKAEIAQVYFGLGMKKQGEEMNLKIINEAKDAYINGTERTGDWTEWLAQK